MSHLIFLDEDTSAEEMSQQQSRNAAPAAAASHLRYSAAGVGGSVCEQCVLYVPHDLMLMRSLDGSSIVHCDC